MPTRKQRRRRAKEHRHEYVWEDAEGNELDPGDVPARKTEGDALRPARGGVRQAQPPSWRRTFKRSLIFAPIMLGTVMLLSSNLTLAAQVTQTALIVAIFVPFSYFLDGVFWRSYQKRLARDGHANRGRTG
jgi:ferric-dicitrate binding protein FerR (iron transport regulator)